MDDEPRVNTRLCKHCGGLGKIMTLDDPPDPAKEEGWETCPRCKGSRVEMSDSMFEAYFIFEDEVEARAFLDAAEGSFDRHGIRRVPNGQLDDAAENRDT